MLPLSGSLGRPAGHRATGGGHQRQLALLRAEVRVREGVRSMWVSGMRMRVSDESRVSLGRCCGVVDRVIPSDGDGSAEELSMMTSLTSTRGGSGLSRHSDSVV